MTPVVSAFDTDGGVIVTTASSDVVVWSPGPSRIAGTRLFCPTPLQSVIWILTGSTWPFLSLFVTGWLVIGGGKAPAAAPAGGGLVLEPRSLCGGLSVALRVQPGGGVWGARL